jgi:predicted membrane-bound spermidine synthase
MAIEIIFHYYVSFNNSVEFILKEDDKTWIATAREIDPMVLLPYVEAIIDFHCNNNTYYMNLYSYHQYHHVIDRLHEISRKCKMDIVNEENEVCILESNSDEDWS